MGFIRKTLFVSTGGLSRAAGLKLNSAEERSAKALEEQLKLQKAQAKAQRKQQK